MSGDLKLMFYLNWLQFPQKADPTKTFSQDLPVKVLLYIPRAALGVKSRRFSARLAVPSPKSLFPLLARTDTIDWLLK
jgi:hypothetical protein